MIRARARHTRSPGRTLLLAGLLALAVLVPAYVAVTAPGGVPLTPHYTVSAQMTDLTNLGAHNEIRIAGDRVGQVLDPRVVGRRAVIDLQLDPRVRPLRSDSRLVVRSKGLLGQRYLEIIPGTRGRPLADGQRLPLTAASSTTQLTEVIGGFDARTRHRLRPLIGQLGVGTAGRAGDIARLVEDAPPILRGLRDVSSAVLARPGAARELFPSLARGMAAAAAARDDIASGFEPEDALFRTFAAQSAGVRELLDVAPGALAGVTAGLHRTDPLLRAAASLSRAAARALPAAPAALDATDRLLRDSPAPLRRATSLLHRVPPLTGPSRRLEARVRPLLPRTDTLLRDTLAPLRVLGPRACDIRGFAHNWHSMLGFGIQGGGAVGPLTTLRLSLSAGPETVGGLSKPLDSAHIGRNPYPAPCEAGSERLP